MSDDYDKYSPRSPRAIETSPRGERANLQHTFRCHASNYPISLRSRIPCRIQGEPEVLLASTLMGAGRAKGSTSNLMEESKKGQPARNYLYDPEFSQLVETSRNDEERVNVKGMRRPTYNRTSGKLKKNLESMTSLEMSMSAKLSSLGLYPPERPSYEGYPRPASAASPRARAGRSRIYTIASTNPALRSLGENPELHDNPRNRQCYANDSALLLQMQNEGASMTTLNLADMNWLSPYACGFIAGLCPSLTSLDASGVDQFDDYSLKQFIVSSENEKTLSDDADDSSILVEENALDVQADTREPFFNDTYSKFDQNQIRNKLEHLNISYCAGLKSPETVANFLEVTKCLRELSMDYMDHLFIDDGDNNDDNGGDNIVREYICMSQDHHPEAASDGQWLIFILCRYWIIYKMRDPNVILDKSKAKAMEDTRPTAKHFETALRSLFFIKFNQHELNNNTEHAAKNIIPLESEIRSFAQSVYWISQRLMEESISVSLICEFVCKCIKEEEAKSFFIIPMDPDEQQKYISRFRKKKRNDKGRKKRSNIKIPNRKPNAPPPVLTSDMTLDVMSSILGPRNSPELVIDYKTGFLPALSSTFLSNDCDNSSRRDSRHKIFSMLSADTLVSLSVAGNSHLTARCISHLGNLLVAQRKLQNQKHKLNEVGATLKSRNSSNIPLSPVDRWFNYNEWVSSDLSTWMGSLLPVAKNDNEIKDENSTDLLKPCYFGRSREMNPYDGNQEGSLPPFANSNSQMSMAGICSVIGKVLFGKLVDDQRCDRVAMKRGKIAAWVDMALAGDDLQKQRLLNSIFKFRESSARVRVFGEMIGWLDAGDGRDADDVWDSILLDILARTLKSPDPISADEDGLNPMLEQLSSPDIILVPLSLLNKAVKFVLKGGFQHPPDLISGERVATPMFIRKILASVKKLAISEKVAGESLIQLFPFLEGFKLEWYRAGQRPRPRLTPRPGFLITRRKTAREDNTKGSAELGHDSSNTAQKSSKGKGGDDAEEEAAQMRVWLAQANSRISACQTEADTLRKKMWEEGWKDRKDMLKAVHAPLPPYPRMSLLSLDLSHCISIGDDGLIHIAQLCPNLRHLRIIGMGSTCGDKGIAALARGCPLIVSLDLTSMISLTDKGLAAIASGMQQLRNLSLAGCTSLSDIGVCALMRSSRLKSSLSKVDLSGCLNLTDVSAKVLLHNCENLSELGLSGCDRMSREEYGLDLANIRLKYPKTVIRCSGEKMAAMFCKEQLENRSHRKSKTLRRFPNLKKPFVSPNPFPGLGFRGGKIKRGPSKKKRGGKRKKK